MASTKKPKKRTRPKGKGRDVGKPKPSIYDAALNKENQQFRERELLRLRFIAAPETDFVSFLKNNNFANASALMTDCPHLHWEEEKRDQRRALIDSQVREAMFKTELGYVDDCLKAVQNLPKVAKLCEGAFIKHFQKFSAREDSANKKDHPATSEMLSLMHAGQKVIEMTQQALLLNKYTVDNVNLTLLKPRPLPALPQPGDENPQTAQFKVGHLDGKPITSDDINKLWSRYLDQPKDVTPVPVEKPVEEVDK